MVANYWLWTVKDMDEAVAWVKRCPNAMPGPGEIEIRPLREMSDFAEAFTPEITDLHDRVREKHGGPLNLDPKLPGGSAGTGWNSRGRGAGACATP